MTEVMVGEIGAQGDGVAVTADGQLYVPQGLPGERWRRQSAGDGGSAWQRLSDSPQRRPPLCRHFGRCGGCVAQHMGEDLYRDWKLKSLAAAFAHRGLEARIGPLVSVPLHSRRRAVLGVARRAGGRVEIGLRQAGTHSLVDLAECPVLHSRIVAALPGLRDLAATVLAAGDGGRLVVTATDGGLDVSLSTGAIALTAGTRAELAAHAARLGLARLEVEGEPVVLRQPPRLTLSGVGIEPPNGVFLQAVAEAEAAMVALALTGVGKARRVADLFCGVGTFTFALARHAEVLAVDGDKVALATLMAAQRTTQGLRRIEARRRDLFKEPLSPLELAGIEAVVMDPPRAGALAQSQVLARSKVGRVVMVSCNPATLARDCRVLVDAGFRAGEVTPIDQFVFSPHLEAVVTLRR